MITDERAAVFSEVRSLDVFGRRGSYGWTVRRSVTIGDGAMNLAERSRTRSDEMPDAIAIDEIEATLATLKGVSFDF